MSIAAPTAADAAVLQVPEEALLSASKRPGDIAGVLEHAQNEAYAIANGYDDAAVVAVAEAMRRMADEKNIRQSEKECLTAVRVALDFLGGSIIDQIGNRDAAAIAHFVVTFDRLLDISAAIQVLTLIQSAAGLGIGDPGLLFRRAEDWVRHRPANDATRAQRHWPEALQAAAHYSALRASSPITMGLPGRPARIACLVDRYACRKGRVDPKRALPLPWWIPPVERFPMKCFGPLPHGPVVEDLADGSVCTSYWHRGELHRDPAQGPAAIMRDASGCVRRQEYWLNGEFVDAEQTEPQEAGDG